VHSASQVQTAFVRDTIHQKQSERGRVCKASGGGILKILKILKKLKNAGNYPKSAQNQKNLKNFNFKMFSKFSKNFGFVRFSGNLQHFLIFQKF
jgi:hypothetical protein